MARPKGDVRNVRINFSVPLTPAEKRTIERAARIVGETPAAFARSTLKRLARQVLQKVGEKVRLDVDEPAGVDQPIDLMPTEAVAVDENGVVRDVTPPR